jgi:5-formyltetrahydrofolate cyclo-ligase
MNDLAAQKRSLRIAVLAARDAMNVADRQRASMSIVQSIIQSALYKNSKSVLAYASFGTEVDTQLLLNQVLTDGKILILPRVIKAENRLSLHRVENIRELVDGVWGIREPRADALMLNVNEADLIIVPGVAFDRTGFRIGYGAGYYDRLLLAANPQSTRLSGAFDCQLVDAVPSESHDQQVDIIITPTQKILVAHDRKNN